PPRRLRRRRGPRSRRGCMSPRRGRGENRVRRGHRGRPEQRQDRDHQRDPSADQPGAQEGQGIDRGGLPKKFKEVVSKDEAKK
ncbi:hypothetical protein BHM03_00049923, partial [Ensete ventricosum]